LKILAGGSVLELAHGTGDLQIEMHQAGIVTTGFDLSRTMGTIATRKLRRRGFDPVLVRGSAMQLPFAQETFDAVVSTFPTEFMIDPSTLQESWRILTPGGRLVFVPNGMLKLTGPLTRILEWLYNVTGQRGPWPVEPLAAFQKAGFDACLLVEEFPQSQVWVLVAQKPVPTVVSNRVEAPAK
jgi:ubiquinone/menaquinone biosynthesis C-methylase UbiE